MITPSDHHPPPNLPSNVKFGSLFVLIFAIAGAYFYFKGHSFLTLAAAALSLLFGLLTTLAPQALEQLNRLWFSLGLQLGKIFSPIVLGIVFFLLITPVSLVTRLFGRDELKLKKRFVTSYWVDRSPPGPDANSFKNQF